MDAFIRRIGKTKAFYEQNNTTQAALVLCLRYLSAFFFTGRQKYTEAAREVMSAAIVKNKADAKLKLLYVFLLLCQGVGKTDETKDKLNDLSRYKGWFKSQEPAYYSIYLFLHALLDYETKDDKGYFKKLQKLNEQDAPPAILPVLTAYLDIKTGNFNNAYLSLNAAQKSGRYTFFIHIEFYMLFAAGVRDKYVLFPSFLALSAAKGLSFDALAEEYGGSVIDKYGSNTAALISIYEYCKARCILERICRNLTMRFDYSLTAYRFYKEAESKQIIIENLEEYLVRASFINKKEDISLFTLTNFLKRPLTDNKLKSFVYHLLLSNSKYKRLVKEQALNITEFAYSLLFSRDKGLYCNSIYAYVLTSGGELSGRRLETCEQILYENMFIYEAELTDQNVDCAWVFEKEKAGHTAFNLTVNPPYNPKLRVKSVSRNLDVMCFDVSKNISARAPKFVKMIPGADTELCRYFYKKHPGDKELIIVMARYYMETNDTSDEGFETISKALSLRRISKSFRDKLSAHLGAAIAAKGGYDKAAEYFACVDETMLADRYAEPMLTAVLKAGNYKKATRIILKKSYAVSDKTLFAAVKEIFEKTLDYAPLAHIAYELVLKSYFDIQLINAVVSCYHGGSRDTLELSMALYEMRAPVFEVDSAVLNNAIESQNPSRAAQLVFVRLNKACADKPIAGDFIYYLCYEMLVKHTKLESETNAVLESVLSKKEDKLLCYALACQYLKHGVKTPNSESIIKNAALLAEKEGIMFPVFEEQASLNSAPLYVIKHTPFIHRAAPGKNVYLIYQIRGANGELGKPKRVQMKYFRFGFYMLALPHFYNEVISYHFKEQTPSARGSVDTPQAEVTNTKKIIAEQPGDSFFSINNALIYEQMFRYDLAEKITAASKPQVKLVRGGLI